MPMNEEIAQIQNRRQFADYIGRFQQQLLEHPDEWGRNQNLESFLEALQMSAITINNVYANIEEPFPDVPTWRLFAEMLYMATDLE